jgi:hypothetical protein
MDIFCFSLAAEASGRSFDATVAGLVRYVFQRTGSAAAGTHRESLPCFVSFGDVYRDSGGTATGVRLCYLQMGSYIRKLTSGEFRWGWGIGRQSYTYVSVHDVAPWGRERFLILTSRSEPTPQSLRCVVSSISCSCL